jgi:uncharacterized protein (TIGR02246 family)
MSKPASNFNFRSAIEALISTFEQAANSKDAATIASMYEQDATLLPPGSPPVKGRANIQAFWQSFLNAGASGAKLRVVEVQSSGEMAYEIGAFDANLPVPQGGTARTAGKYVVVWRLQPNGSIKMVADIFNVNA